MRERRRTRSLVLIILAGTLFGLSAGVPAFAWTSTLKTTIQCYNVKTGWTDCVSICSNSGSSWGTADTGSNCCSSSESGTYGSDGKCSSSDSGSGVMISGGTTIRDMASLTLSLVCEKNGVTEYDGNCTGTYQLTCVNLNPSANCGTISFYLVTGAPPTSCPTAKPSGATAEGSSTVPTSNDGKTDSYYSSSIVVSGSGEHYFWVQYGGTPSNGGVAGYPAQYACEKFQISTSAPQFPLGMTLVIALAIPGVLLIRGRFKTSFPTSSSVS
jgi:hypothetical protein